MATILSIEGKPVPGIYELVIDEADELQTLTMDHVKPGSKVLCIEDSKTYMMDSSGTWNEVNFKRGSGGGGGSNFFIVTFTTNNNTHTADKTYAEVYSAYEDGKLIIFYYGGCCALAAFGTVGTERFEANLTRILLNNPQTVEAIAIKYTGMYGGWIDINIKELATT